MISKQPTTGEARPLHREEIAVLSMIGRASVEKYVVTTVVSDRLHFRGLIEPVQTWTGPAWRITDAGRALLSELDREG